MNSIPISTVVNVTPGVIGVGGNALQMSGLVLTQNLLMPTGTVLSFANAAAVSNFFGPSSAEYAYASLYFAGFTLGTQTPGAILFAPYNASARAGWLQSGSMANVTLAQLQAIAPGTLTITFAGTGLTSSSINLSSATSFSDAATIIQAAFTTPPFAVTWDAVQSAFIFTSTSTGATETIIYPTDTIATALHLTQATGGTLSQGAAADTPSSAMNNAVAASENWATFSYITEPDLATKELFAAWVGTQNGYYQGVMWDSDTQASVSGATEPFGVVAKTAAYNGVICIGGDPAAATAQGTTLSAIAQSNAAFYQGLVASINFNVANGSVDPAGKTSLSAGCLIGCQNLTTYENLLANGYNCYGAFAGRNQNYAFFSNGNVPGEFVQAQQYLNQIWFNAAMQQSLAALYTSVNFIPEDTSGVGLIKSALVGAPSSNSSNTSGTPGGPINTALLNGTIQVGIPLTAAQAAEVNAAAGVNCAGQLTNVGYYLKVSFAGTVANVQLWYTGGQSVQTIQLSSVDVL